MSETFLGSIVMQIVKNHVKSNVEIIVKGHTLTAIGNNCEEYSDKAVKKEFIAEI